MSGFGEGWDGALARWADAQVDIRALVQIGSRVQPGARVDALSDYDYQLVTTHPERYADGAFARELGPCWVSGAHVAFGRATKVTAVFEGALEADFVILRHAEVAVACAALRWPVTRPLWPARLRLGIEEFRIVAAPGWRVVKGGAVWERRYARLSPFRSDLTAREFERLCGEFWTQLVWAAKKRARGEYLACQWGIHEHLMGPALRILQEQAHLEGRDSYPLARRAEGWLEANQLSALAGGTRPEPAALAASLSDLAGLFEGASAAVAAAKGWRVPATADVRDWLRDALARPTGTAPR